MSIFAKAKEMKKNKKKGFTLVELIVVLVILAILAAVLVPALLGYIDKAREKQIITNASAALTAAQSLADEAYGKDVESATLESMVTSSKIAKLTDITASFSVTAKYGSNKEATNAEVGNKNTYKITEFTYTESNKTATWNATTGNWSVA